MLIFAGEIPAILQKTNLLPFKVCLLFVLEFSVFIFSL
jgi:hypothetical protein